MYEAFVKEILSETILPHLQSDVKTTALNIIADALFLTYGDYDINKLVIRCELETEAYEFSKHICSVLDQSTVDESIWIVVKEILRFLPISIFFINKLGRFQQNVYDVVIPIRIKKKINFDRVFYVNVINRFKTSFKTLHSLKTAFAFVHKFLETYDFREGQFFTSFTKKDVVKFCKNDQNKLKELRTFLNDALNQTVPEYWFEPFEFNPDSDLITTQDVATVYTYVKDLPYEELIFLLLLTTNVTVHGLNKIKIQNIAEITNYKIVVKTQGFIERKKSQIFPVCPRVSKLIESYLLDVRPAVACEYLFLKSYKSIANSVKKFIKNSGLGQKKFKPIIFGRTYTRFLSEGGNSSDEVLNCLQKLVEAARL